jgi:hypothetical protein
MALAAIFVSMFLDPILAVPAMLCGAFARQWALLVACSAAISLTHEWLLVVTQFSRNTSFAGIVVASLAALAWCALSRSIAASIRGRRTPLA